MVQHEFAGVRAVLLDIEGTTTPITFVKDVLFPYVLDNVDAYLAANWSDRRCVDDVSALIEQAERDSVEGRGGEPAVALLLSASRSSPARLCAAAGCGESASSHAPAAPAENTQHDANGDGGEAAAAAALRKAVADNVRWQVSIDRKATALKQLQGHMWRAAYESGSVRGQVYDDVVPALERWIASGKQAFIYSSGSVEAQKLLFSHSTRGNVLPLLSGHFDTTTGAKTDSTSYSAIASAVQLPVDSILFLTDVVAEARAAKSAGLQVGVVLRPGNKPLTDDERRLYTCVSSFDELSI